MQRTVIKITKQRMVASIVAGPHNMIQGLSFLVWPPAFDRTRSIESIANSKEYQSICRFLVCCHFRMRPVAFPLFLPQRHLGKIRRPRGARCPPTAPLPQCLGPARHAPSPVDPPSPPPRLSHLSSPFTHPQCLWCRRPAPGPPQARILQNPPPSSKNFGQCSENFGPKF